MKNILIGVVLLTSISAIANCNIIIKTAPACETMLKYESRHGGGRCTYFQDDITSAVEKLGFVPVLESKNASFELNFGWIDHRNMYVDITDKSSRSRVLETAPVKRILGFGAHDGVSIPKLMHNILNSNIQCR